MNLKMMWHIIQYLFCTVQSFPFYESQIFLSDPLTIESTEYSPNSAPKQNDVYIVNLALCSDVQVKNEVNKVPEQPQSLNLQRVS